MQHLHERDWALDCNSTSILSPCALGGSPFCILGGASFAVDLTGSEDVLQSLYLLWCTAGAHPSHTLAK